jgi:hypothetical protein
VFYFSDPAGRKPNLGTLDVPYIKMIFLSTMLNIIGMQQAIGNMLKNGVKNISDETARAYFEHLVGLGVVVVDGKEMTGSALMRDYDDFAKHEFKEAGKAVTKGGKKKKDSDDVGVAKPKRAKSAYLLFCEDVRPSVQAEGLKFTEVAKRLGELWADPATKEKWQAVALERKLTAEGGEDVPVMEGKPVKVKAAVKAAGKEAAGKDVVTDAMGVTYATTAAEKFAIANNIDGGLAKYGADATGKDGAFKLVDLKKIVENEAKMVGEAECEEEEEEECEEEECDDEEEEEECDEEETDPKDWVGWSCRVWSVDEDDWECGEITKYNAKKSTHTVKYENGTSANINIKELEVKEHFEWDE